ncbi:hypothetical protein FOMPIDRAFT_1013208 [Fomitopsis schrenkii]|uniref:Uncharacterized protein n=1 Tax=Fomitopsis schrenkii TaxID=2126942 RepID=S8FWC7_FOMSC|nr:hypothetical protein FOMPIDRAFT_1013208 [Fomitopsis schrenkii]
MMEEDSTEGDEGQPKPKKKAHMQDNNDSDGSDIDVDMLNEGGDPESEEEAELPKSTQSHPKPAYGKYAKASASLNAPEEAIAQNLARLGQPPGKAARKPFGGAASDSQVARGIKVKRPTSDRKADNGKAKALSSGIRNHGTASRGRESDSEKDELDESDTKKDDEYKDGEEEDDEEEDDEEEDDNGEEGEEHEE